MEFEVRTTVSVENHLTVFRAGKVHFKNDPNNTADTSIGLSRGKTVLLYVVAFAVFVASLFVRELHWLLSALPVFVAGMLFAFFIFYRSANSEKALRKRFAKDELIGRLHVIHFSDDGFQSIVPDWEIRYSYHTIQAVYETETYFILFVTKTTAEAVKKSGFTTGDPAQFAEFIQQKTGLTIQYLK